MRLPRFEGQSPKVSREILSSRGLNRTNDYIDGDLEDCDRITGAELPYLRTDSWVKQNFQETKYIRGIATEDETLGYNVRGSTLYYGDSTVIADLDQWAYVWNGIGGETIFDGGLSPEDSRKLSILRCGDDVVLPDANMLVSGVNGNTPSLYTLAFDFSYSYEDDDIFRAYVFFAYKDEPDRLRIMKHQTGGSYAPVPSEEKEYVEQMVFQALYHRKDGDAILLTLRDQERGVSVLEQAVTVRYFHGDYGLVFYEELSIPAEAYSGNEARFTFLRARREFPALAHCVWHDNRLFGVTKSGMVHVSALGQPGNLFEYKGLSTDSFTVDLNDDIRGIATLSDRVLFFAKLRVYKLLGKVPDEFTVYQINTNGVRAACSRSVAEHNNAVYYVGDGGVFRYDGGESAVCLSRQLGAAVFNNSVGFANDTGYFVSSWEGDGVYWLYTYHFSTGAWFRKRVGEHFDFLYGTNLTVNGICNTPEEPGREAEARVRSIGTQAWRYQSEPPATEAGKPWCMEFKPFREETMGKKGPSRLLLRLALTRGSWCRILLKEGPGEWKEIRLLREIGPEEALEQKERVEEVRIAPGRCDVFRVRLEGEGSCRVLGIQRETIIGGVR